MRSSAAHSGRGAGGFRQPVRADDQRRIRSGPDQQPSVPGPHDLGRRGGASVGRRDDQNRERASHAPSGATARQRRTSARAGARITLNPTPPHQNAGGISAVRMVAALRTRHRAPPSRGGTPTCAGRSAARIGPGPTAGPSAPLRRKALPHALAYAGLHRSSAARRQTMSRGSPSSVTAGPDRLGPPLRHAGARSRRSWESHLVAGGRRRARWHPLGPWTRAHGRGDQGSTCTGERRDAVPRAWLSAAEGLHGVLQQQAPRPAARQGDPLHAATGVGAADPTAFRSCLNACPTHIAGGTRSARGPLGFLCSRDACFVRFIAGRTPRRCTPA